MPEGILNILSEFAAIFLCEHLQHNFYSGLNKRKAKAIVGQTQWSYCSEYIMTSGLAGRKSAQFLGPEMLMVIKSISRCPT